MFLKNKFYITKLFSKIKTLDRDIAPNPQLEWCSNEFHTIIFIYLYRKETLKYVHHMPCSYETIFCDCIYINMILVPSAKQIVEWWTIDILLINFVYGSKKIKLKYESLNKHYYQLKWPIKWFLLNSFTNKYHKKFGITTVT